MVSGAQNGAVSLDELYSTALEEAFKWDDEMISIFRDVMSVVLFGKTQFTNDMVDGILGLGSDEGSDIILSKLRPLLAYTRDQPIRLHHTSFFDYLTSCVGKPWFIDVAGARKMLAERCLDVLCKLLHFNMAELETSFLRNDEVQDLNDRIARTISMHLRYVCRYWAEHLRNALFSEDLLRMLTAFVNDHLLHWFEVLSLTNNFLHISVQLLYDAISWLPVRILHCFKGHALMVC